MFRSPPIFKTVAYDESRSGGSNPSSTAILQNKEVVVSVSIDQFVGEIGLALLNFKKQWKANNSVQPDIYPLELSDENSGAWMDLFFTFLEHEIEKES